jgi:hypothetical protein
MLIYLITAIELTPCGSNTVHIYTQTIHRTAQLTTLVGRLFGIRTQIGQTKINDELTAWNLSLNWKDCGPCPVFARYTLAFALQLRKKHEQTSVRVAGECQLARWRQNIQNRTYSPSSDCYLDAAVFVYTVACVTACQVDSCIDLKRDGAWWECQLQSSPSWSWKLLLRSVASCWLSV